MKALSHLPIIGVLSLKVFISYRRDDSAPTAGRIDDRLVSAFGRENVYKDVDVIPLGVDFREHIKEAVSRCDVLLALIGERWTKDEKGRRRLDEESDWVRIEIETALSRKIPVIPVLIGGTEMVQKADLPPSIQELVFRNATPVRRDPDFHRDVDRLVAALRNSESDLKRPLRAQRSDGKFPVRMAGAAAVVVLLFVSLILGVYYWHTRTTGGNAREERQTHVPNERAGDEGTTRQTKALDGQANRPGPERQLTVLREPANPSETSLSKGNADSAPSTKSESTPQPPKASSVANPQQSLASAFAKMPKGEARGEFINVALWVASPILDRDVPIFESLAASMNTSGARLVAVSWKVKDLAANVAAYDDPRNMLDLKSFDAFVIYGVQRSDMDVPLFMKQQATTSLQRAHFALAWASLAGKDAFLIVPPEKEPTWKFRRLNPPEFLAGDHDAVDAAKKCLKVTWVGDPMTGNDFTGFFTSMKSRAQGSGDIRNITK